MSYTRDEVESMVDARVETAILKYHKENTSVLHNITVGLSELRARIIGIDGNGTGQVGAIQRIERTLRFQNRVFFAVLGGIGTAVLGVGTLLVVEYVKFHAGWK